MLISLLMAILAEPLICLILTAASLDGSSGVILDGTWTARNSNKSIVIPANIPGGIYTDLMRAKVIGDPYFRFNDELYKWVGRENWEFYRTFEVPNGLLSKKRVSLVAEGLDTIGSIFINDKLVGTSDNMFVRYNFNVTSHLRASNNSIKISFVSPVNYAKNRSQEYQTRNVYVVPPVCPPVIQNGECHVNFIRKCQSSFSWDWGPSFPSTGIWKSIRIEAYNTVIIRDVSVFPVPKNSNLTDWSLNITVYYETATITAIPGTLSVALNGTFLFVEALELPSNALLQGNIAVTAHIPPKYPIKLWWPNGYGDQPLYNLSVMFTDSFKSETSKSVNIGFRTVKLIEEKIQGSTGLSFYFQINSVPIFAKGSNWIPADSFPERITKDYIRHLLQSAKDANMNMLRVWGGGIYEPDSFYELADEMGILIWQDMMFAVALYPVNEFLNNVATEVQQQIQRLQHHPSIVVWAGNNENEASLAQGWWPEVATDFGRYKRDYIKLYINTIKPIVTQDKSRPFLASSPSNGKISEQEGWISSNPQDYHYGDVHFYTYSSDGWNWRSYPRARFVSEYGFQSYPSFETFSNISLPEDWTYPFGKFLFHRQHHIFGGMEILMSIKSHLFLPNKKCGVQAFKDVLYLSQITQAMSIKTETEFYRRSQTGIVRGEGKTMGALYWQLNDIWQAPTWSSIEYGGKWKMLHYYAVNFFNNYLVSPFDDKRNISVAFISDQPKRLSNLSLILEVHRWSSINTTYTRKLTFSQPPQSSQVIYTTPISELLAQAKCNTQQECFLNFLVTDKKGLQLGPSNFYFFTSFHEAKGLGKANITVESVSLTSSATGSKGQVYAISLATDRVAPFVWLDSPTVKGHFSTNGFLFLSPKMKVQFYAKQAISSEILRKVLTVKSLMDTCV